MRNTIQECSECRAGTRGTCHEEALCDHHKVIVRPLQARVSPPRRDGYHRCVECAWYEGRPHTAQEIKVYLHNALFWSALAGWDQVAWNGKPNLLDLLRGMRAAARAELAA
jgi:hypothetical protein